MGAYQSPKATFCNGLFTLLLSFKTMAYENEADLIPTIEVFEENHPLTNDQQLGITYATAIKKCWTYLRANTSGKCSVADAP